MPLYEYRCEECGLVFEEHRAVEARNIVTCPICGSMPPVVAQWFSTPRYISPDLEPYLDRGMGAGVWIDGRAKRREEMKQRGLNEAGDSSLEKQAKELLEEHAERKRSKADK